MTINSTTAPFYEIVYDEFAAYVDEELPFSAYWLWWKCTLVTLENHFLKTAMEARMSCTNKVMVGVLNVKDARTSSHCAHMNLELTHALQRLNVARGNMYAARVEYLRHKRSVVGGY